MALHTLTLDGNADVRPIRADGGLFSELEVSNTRDQWWVLVRAQGSGLDVPNSLAGKKIRVTLEIVDDDD